MSSPGLTRMTGGSSRPSKRKAAFPVCGSLIAVKFTGERTSGALGSRLDGGILLGSAGLWANRCTLQSKPKHVTLADTFRPAINNQIAIMSVPSQPDATTTSGVSVEPSLVVQRRAPPKPSTQREDVDGEVYPSTSRSGQAHRINRSLSLTGCRSERFQTNSHVNKELQKSSCGTNIEIGLLKRRDGRV